VEPYVEVALFALGALVLGVVIFGGTTLAYFVGKRTPEPSRQAGTEFRPGELETIRPPESATAPKDKAA